MTARMVKTPPLLLLAVGNPSRGDDALGPCLLERLAATQLLDVLRGQADDTPERDRQCSHACGVLTRRVVSDVECGGQPTRVSS